jgi:hypothetical protein
MVSGMTVIDFIDMIRLTEARIGIGIATASTMCISVIVGFVIMCNRNVAVAIYEC